jgi:hypothetical protein
MRTCAAVRVALLLALGCLATCHGSAEQEAAVYELGESKDVDGGSVDAEVADDEPSADDYHIESEDQEDRIGVSSVDDFDQDDTTPPAHKASSDSDFDQELKVIQDGDDHTDLGEGVEASAKSPDAIAAAADTQEKNTKSMEVSGKASDKAIESKKKQNEVTNKEEDARVEARKKEEVDNKETATKAKKRHEERYSKKQAEEKAEKDKDNELKAKDDAETKRMEVELVQSRKESELDGKRETASEKKDKTEETAQKKQGIAESQEKTAEQDRVAAENVAMKEKDQKTLEKKAKQDKKEADDAAAVKTADDQRALEADKKDIKEKGDKAYANEVNLEQKQKAEHEETRLAMEKATKKKEMRNKQVIATEQAQKVSEQRDKSDKRDEFLMNSNKKASQADEQAHKGASYERVAKSTTTAKQKDLSSKIMEMSSAEAYAEHSQKTTVKAFTKDEVSQANQNEKLAKSKLSEIQSKVAEAKKDVQKAQEHRELAGKVGRERAIKYKDVQTEHTEEMKKAKGMAQTELAAAQKARAEVDYIHSKMDEKDSKEAADKWEQKESSLKNEVTAADSALLKRHKAISKNDKIEKDDEAGQKKDVEKHSKFTQQHVEAREKDLQVDKQRVASWMKYDVHLEGKLSKMKQWLGETKKASIAAGDAEVTAQKAVEGFKAAAERAWKKSEEIKEKEKMNQSFKELVHKDDEREKQDALKKISEEKEVVEKDKDRADRAEEREEKNLEVVNKARTKEKESLDKMQEQKTKTAEAKTAEEKSTKREKTTKADSESNQKKDMDLLASVASFQMKEKAAEAAAGKAGLTAEERAKAEDTFAEAATATHMAKSQEKAFKVQVDEEKTAGKKEEEALEEQKKAMADTEKKYENNIKSELQDKNAEKLAEEVKGKAKVKEMADKTKLKEAQATAAAEARKAVRVAEKAVKDITNGRAKDERKAKQLALQVVNLRERNGKKGDAQVTFSKAHVLATKKKAASYHATVTLGQTQKKQDRWKDKLDTLQAQEGSDREKEMKALPYKIVVAEQIKYRKETAGAQKIMDDSENSHEAMKTQWQTKEGFTKKFAGKEKMLKEDKKTLLKSLSKAVRAEYKTGKELKEERAKFDEGVLDSQKKQGKLQALEAFELAQQQLEEDAKAKAAAAEKDAKAEEASAQEKAQALSDAESNAEAAAQQDSMKGDVATGAEEVAAKAAATSDSAKSKSLEQEKAANEKEAAEKSGALNKKKAEEDTIKEKADSKKRESQVKIVELKSHLATEKKDKTAKEAEMKNTEKKATENVRKLRHSEMKTKHAEIEERSKMQAAEAVEAELAKRKESRGKTYRTNRELFEKAQERVKMAAKVISDTKNGDSANSAKEVGTKVQIANNHKQFSAEQKEDKALRDKLERATTAKSDAEDRKATSAAAYRRAQEEEKEAKNDALERNKKTEATAIQDAIEKKNKAAEKAVKAFEFQSEVKKKQYVAAKIRGAAVENRLQRLEESKTLLGTKYGMTDEWQVGKMEKVAGEDVEMAEAKEKSSARVVEMTSNEAASAADRAGHARNSYDRAEANLKKANDVRDAREASKEGASKQAAMAVKENDKKIALKEVKDIDMQSRISTMKEKKAKFKSKERHTKYKAQVKKEVEARRHADEASSAKLKSSQAYQDAKQHQESAAKLSDRFRTVSAGISENTNKVKTTKATVQSEEKSFKFAADQVTKAKTSCTTGKKATIGIGKAYKKLKMEVKEWSLKHKWLKQTDDGGEEHGLDGSDNENVGEGKGGEESIITKTSNDLVADEMRDDVDFAPLSVTELIQQEAGPEVVEWIFT